MRRREVNLAGIAVVTGAGSGIGRATAHRLAGLGAKVHVADIDEAAAAAVAEEIAGADDRAVAHTVDVSDASAVEALAATVFEQDGAVDVLHNNAGIGHAGPVDETPLEDWRLIVEINLMGAIHGIHAFVPRMLEQGRPAHVVNTASALGLTPGVELAPYSTTKFALVGLSQSLDAELAPRGIGVTALCPGIISTAIVERTTARGGMAERKAKTVDFYRRRGASPDVVADAVVTAILKRHVIQPVPASHVYPGWIAGRVSPRLGQAVARLTHRLIIGTPGSDPGP
jgi:NAD(P)-dependent dehydrogenase (short-subunit alcohol dehydrogenase family)